MRGLFRAWFYSVWPWPRTCIRVLVLPVFCPGFLSLTVVLAAALIQPCVHAGAAVAQLAFPTADDRVLGVDLLRTLKPFFPSALGVLPAVAILPAGLHVDDGQEKGHDHGDIRREPSSVHPRPGGPCSAARWRTDGDEISLTPHVCRLGGGENLVDTCKKEKSEGEGVHLKDVIH